MLARGLDTWEGGLLDKNQKKRCDLWARRHKTRLLLFLPFLSPSSVLFLSPLLFLGINQICTYYDSFEICLLAILFRLAWLDNPLLSFAIV